MTETNLGEFDFDVFVSYASEDREDLVLPLHAALEQRGVRVWVDYREIQIGDSLRQEIDSGLARSRFGVVVLSPHSFDKFWTNLEWDALLAREDAEGTKRILPIRQGATMKLLETNV